MMIIGLAGRAGCGKSTCAKWLEKNYGAKLYSFADPLKRMASDIWGWPLSLLQGSQADKERFDPRVGMSPRTAMIGLGHSARVCLEEDVWLKAALRQIRLDSPKLAVVQDVRYANEARAIALSPLEKNYVIRLSCPNARTQVDPSAPSEKSVDEIPGELLVGEVTCAVSEDAINLIRCFREIVEPILKREGF